MSWEPFVVAAAGTRTPQPRGINTAEGLGDRLRTAAFAEEDRHLGWLLGRMRELGVDPAGRPVSDRLWRSLAARDPATAAIFGRIAEEETAHIALQADGSL